MKADIYEPSITRNEYTNSVEKTWTIVKTIDCLARGIVTTSTGSNSANFVTSKYINYPENTIKLKSKEPIDVSMRVVAIRNGSQVIYQENQYGNSNGGVDGATIFEPRGSTAITDHLGNILEYETMLERQEVQSLEVE
jgi:hypothetical protein